MTIKSKASEIGGALGVNGIIDVDSTTYAVRRKNIRGATGAFTQNTTVKTSLGALGFKGTLKSGHLSFVTVPAGGALTVKIVAYDASANAEIVLTDALDAEGATSREGLAFVLAATNVALEADDTIEVHTIADNNAVGTAAVGGLVSLLFDPTEATSVDQ